MPGFQTLALLVSLKKTTILGVNNVPTIKFFLPGTNAAKLSILFRSDADSRATHPASSKTLKSEEEAPLSRGELRKTLSIRGSIRSTESLNSPLERGGCEAAGVCLILHEIRSTM